MTGIRFVKGSLRGMGALKKTLKAEDFRPELRAFLRRVLIDCVKLTPARNASIIRANQKKQYANRINYIPSIHKLIDPTLIVTKTGDEWLFSGGKWYRPDQWKLPDDVWNIYCALMFERNRRLNISAAEFITFREQARMLYKKTWWQAAQRQGIDIPVASNIKSAISRRTESQLQSGLLATPSRAYIQIRGGKDVASYVVYNPFLETQTAYWNESGVAILNDATERNRARFKADIERSSARMLRAFLKASNG